MTKAQKQEQENARAELRGMLTPGQRVYATVKHVSRSGMQRTISLYIVEGEVIRGISHLAATAVGWRHDHDRGGVKVGGCGMDMAFHLVYTLGTVIWPKGTPKPHGKRNGQPDREGGYALKKEWL